MLLGAIMNISVGRLFLGEASLGLARARGQQARDCGRDRARRTIRSRPRCCDRAEHRRAALRSRHGPAASRPGWDAVKRGTVVA